MSATTLDGKAVAARLSSELRATLSTLPFSPQLVVVRVGEDPASVSYVRGKDRTAKALGLRSRVEALPEATDQGTLMQLVQALSADPDVDGILVQDPLPPHLSIRPVQEAIDPAKDVDGFHPVNVGRLWNGEEALVPCTPAGLVRIMDHYGLPIAGREVVIVGRSTLVGKPAAALFLGRHATVTVAHSKTRDLATVTRRADILVAAVGRHALITPEMVKPGAVVLDVGINRVDGRLKGDVHPGVAEVAGYLTPVPGGVGPMTVAMLMQNTVTAALRRRGDGPVGVR
ncbi:bifunctional methylenetetrahydrofolate dehydrogenase/methenyltetrahydrofolate cyclohydrolase [Truepera radiovictrix]|uniref:Bifunctional protein FolD n=1 Tax=Truepera radiovictrix (strain DSM 17093 / CIP 108686 / LMG 22925 / RQ-24) TaxID=649638 RepID=D7CVY3_TRURR|nr:bifunctional methylenetetrahydrofolate dehydrogenase/methenyltetrahydrofolate cyclohydrolase [Truepera radiovictrix]ADI14246.1 Methylenetetrahydrofolate dehydrogenase (NADP(+)) [Truepera radiovictrix DSM 17093]WMT57197.1 bifunctional methylenetetrahydrofolate dehydrogenase/methenyltetrahydrofolate cyclohydrolase [Truepera radiovictrix]